MDIEETVRQLKRASEEIMRLRDEHVQTIRLLAEHPVMQQTRDPDDWAVLLSRGDPELRREIRFRLERFIGDGAGASSLVVWILADGNYQFMAPLYAPWICSAAGPCQALLEWIIARRQQRGLGWMVQDRRTGASYGSQWGNHWIPKTTETRYESTPVTDAGKTHIMLDKHDDSKTISVRRIASTYEGTCNFCNRREPSPEHKLSEIRIKPLGHGARFRVCDECAPRIVNDLRAVISGLCLVAAPTTPASST